MMKQFNQKILPMHVNKRSDRISSRISRVRLFYNIKTYECADLNAHFYLLQNAQVFNVKSFHLLLIGTYYQNKSVFDLIFPGLHTYNNCACNYVVK